VYLAPPLKIAPPFLEMGNTGWAQDTTSMMWLPGGERSLAISLAVWIHQIKSNHISIYILLNSGSHESALVTRKVHSHTNFKTYNMQQKIKHERVHPQLRPKVS